MMGSVGENGSRHVFADGKTEVIAAILGEMFHLTRGARILVVGCGSGMEAAVLAKALQANVVGIDVSDQFDETARQVADLRLGDATAMDFEDRTFDFVFSYHALEHIPNYQMALKECKRVLRQEGGYFIGTPNRSRLIGYLGSKDATMVQKILWNMNDWSARVRGTFRNEHGAHAGYSAKELREILGVVFSEVDEITDRYYDALYPRLRKPICILRSIGADRFVLPSVYFVGVR
jgi:ubiquinone/menaquinone biosynthesis C-methylase UbiE